MYLIIKFVPAGLYDLGNEFVFRDIVAKTIEQLLQYNNHAKLNRVAYSCKCL